MDLCDGFSTEHEEFCGIKASRMFVVRCSALDARRLVSPGREGLLEMSSRSLVFVWKNRCTAEPRLFPDFESASEGFLQPNFC